MNNKKIINIVLVLFAVYKVTFAESGDLIDRAVKEYLRGDYIGAIQDFERVLELENNEKAEKLLYKSIVEEGKRQYNNSKFKDAKQYFERANEIQPDNSEVINMLSKVNKKLGAKAVSEKESRIAVDALQEKVEKERTQKNVFRNRLNSLTSERNRLKKDLKEHKEKLQKSLGEIEQLTDTIRKKQKKLVFLFGAGCIGFIAVGVILIIVLRRVYSASGEHQYQLEELGEKFTVRLDEAKKEGGELEEKVAKSINKMIEEQKEVVKQMSMSVGGKTQTDIEEIKIRLEKHFEVEQNKLIELLNQQIRVLSIEKTEKIELADRVITDINPHVRARADSVELIPRTISDPNVAEKMLKPFLSDPNNRVRANAARAIYQYNPELALATLNDMASSPDKWMRLSTAWAVGEIAAPEVTGILRKLLDDVDESVKNRAIEAFENMADVKEDIAKEIRNMIDEGKKTEEE